MKIYLKDLTPDEVIRRLKAGEVIKCDGENYETKFIDGFICTDLTKSDSIYRPFIISDSLSIDENCGLYFETPDELKLEVGKCYKTRDGRKAFIFVKDDYNYRGVVVGSTHDYAWRKNGKSVYSTDENDLDLISEWNDDEEKEND